MTESCGEPVCDGEENAVAIKSSNFAKGQTVREEEAVLHAGTSVFVLNPGDSPSEYKNSFCVMHFFF